MTAHVTADTRPTRWVPTLYVAEGLPFVAIMTVSVLMYKSLGLSDTKIAAFTSLVAWPWSLKPLWSGFMECAGRKKRLVVAAELLGGVSFGLIGLSLSTRMFLGLSLSLFAVAALWSASHDIAADGLYIECLTKEQQATYIGYASGFWSVGRILAQGALVWLAGTLEGHMAPVGAWQIVIGVLALLMIALALYHQQTLPQEATQTVVAGMKEVLLEARLSIRTFFAQQYIWQGLLFVILYRFAEGQAMKILPLFLRAERARGGLGLPTSTVGVAYGTLGAVACIGGAVMGGHFAAKRGLRSALFPLCVAFNLPYLCYVVLAWTQPKSLPPVAIAIIVEWFGYGFGFVAVTLFMMQQMTSGKFKMSHYAIATSAMNLGLILPGAWSGWLSDHIGYRNFFLWVMVSTAASFIVTRSVRFRDAEFAPQAAGEAA